MSAICGLMSLNGRSVQLADLKRIDTAQARLGRRSGCWSEGGVGLAQRQSIFTPEDSFERQPLTGNGGTRIIIFDGRLDNRPDLLRELGAAQNASETPDSAIVSKAIDKWGDKAPSRLIGDFAIAVWDATKLRLSLIRSPFGRRPLFYHQTEGTLSFATWPAALYTLPWVRRGLSLRFAIEDRGDLSLYRDILQVPPAHVVEFDNQGIRTREYWQLEPNGGAKLKADAIEAFTDLLDRVVEQHLRASSEVGIFLSGGLDSSSVAATAAPIMARRGRRLAAFCEVPRPGIPAPVPSDRYADETPLVRALAAMHPSIALSLVDAGDATIWTDLEVWFEAALMPPPIPLNRVYFNCIARRAAAANAKVMLTGNSGNATISWEGERPLPALLRQRRYRRAWMTARAGRSGAAWACARIVKNGILPLLTPGCRRRGRKMVLPLRADIRDRVAANQPEPHLDRLRAFALSPRFAGVIEAGFQIQYGLELRDPAGDRRILEFCTALPDEQFLDETGDRLLIRRAMAGRLPEAIRLNHQRGLQAADGLHYLQPSCGRIRAESEAIAANDFMQEYFDLNLLTKLADGLDTGRFPHRADPVFSRALHVHAFGLFVLWFEQRYGADHE